MFTLSSHDLNGKRKIFKYFWRYSFQAHLPPALEISADLMPLMWI